MSDRDLVEYVKSLRAALEGRGSSREVTELKALLDLYLLGHGRECKAPPVVPPRARSGEQDLVDAAWSLYEAEYAAGCRSVLGTCAVETDGRACGAPAYKSPGGAICDVHGGGVPVDSPSQ